VGSNPATSTAKALEAVWFRGLFVCLYANCTPNESRRKEGTVKGGGIFERENSRLDQSGGLL